MSERPGETHAFPADPPETARDRSAAEPVEIASEPFPLTEPAPEAAEAPAEKPPRTRTKTIVLGSLLAVSLAGAGILGYAGWRIATQKDATLQVPSQVGALKLNTSDNGRSTADYLRTALSADVELDKAVGAVYSDGSGNDVLFFGGTTLFWTPEDDLDTAFGLISDAQGSVTGLHDVAAGPLGGTMKCGTTKSDATDMAVCGWADHGSLALAMFPGRSEADSAGLLREIRGATQTRD
ncbi:hypothetical protein [Couchioplanes azureus]|uniref:hypothetical protein n=1 Tax=Couchioplanes caeruleus TaxID=56438 RepID=UPI00167086BF|nr:hypothetical protein [Couchioplanes caeruleus]GGQ80517.1 hypothetical protein GCM10010166_58420 [Couchioplanes caeruleus subsp. azureus]